MLAIEPEATRVTVHTARACPRTCSFSVASRWSTLGNRSGPAASSDTGRRQRLKAQRPSGYTILPEVRRYTAVSSVVSRTSSEKLLARITARQAVAWRPLISLRDLIATGEKELSVLPGASSTSRRDKQNVVASSRTEAQGTNCRRPPAASLRNPPALHQAIGTARPRDVTRARGQAVECSHVARHLVVSGTGAARSRAGCAARSATRDRFPVTRSRRARSRHR